MKILKTILFISVSFLIFSCSSEDEALVIAAGAGYKKPVLEICEKFTEETGIKVESIFGNMQTVSVQVKQSGKVGILIGDKSFLENPNLGVEYAGYTGIGKGKLVLAFPKNINISNIEDILEDDISRVSMPDTAKAIYGKAAKEYLVNSGWWESIQEKIIPAATVPQVSSYLVSGEVDAGFINLTDAIGVKEDIGGYIIIEEKYSPIEIVAGSVKGFEKENSVDKFLKYIETDEAVKIFKKYGL